MEEVPEEDVIMFVQQREKLIERARKLVDMTHSRSQVVGVIARELVNIKKDLRQYGIRCVEKIVAWTLRNTTEEDKDPICFLWEGKNYLCKMLHDLDFLTELSESYHLSFETGDPFFVKGKDGYSASDRRTGQTATFIVLDAYARMEKKELQQKGGFGDTKLEPTPIDRNNDKNRRSFRKSAFEKRAGVGDIYKFISSGKAKRTSARKSAIEKSAPNSVVFKGSMLYQRGKWLGTGAHAKVYECERQDGAKFAVKCFNFSYNSRKEDDETLNAKKCYRREVEYLRMLNHPNIIRFEETMLTNGEPFIVMEKMRCTLLELQVERPQVMATSEAYSPVEQKAIDILHQISKGLCFMHNNSIIHRDIKPENILILPSAVGIIAKIGDMGSALEITSMIDGDSKNDLTHYIGSRCYRAPEVLGCGTDYSFECDIWSLGCTIAEFITGRPLFPGDNEQKVLDVILSYFNASEYPPNMDQNFWSRGLAVNENFEKKSLISELGSASGLTQTIKSALCLNPENRFSANDINRDSVELCNEVAKMKESSKDEDARKKTYIFTS